MRSQKSLFEDEIPRRTPFQLHMLFADVCRGGGNGRSRHATDYTGGSIDTWRTLDAFCVASGGDEGGLILVYYSPDRILDGAQQKLRELGHVNFLGHGTINAFSSHPEWRFESPKRKHASSELLRQMAIVPEFLRYYSDFLVIFPDGSQPRKVRDFADPE